jgi:RNA polymerase sigma-70 factor (ECF subfamily)
MYSQSTEDSLVERAVQRDRAAFTALYDKYVDRIYRHVYYRVSNRGDAEDITQEVFIRAWKAINKYKRRGVPFVAWLLAIAHNLVVDYYKTRKEFIPLDETRVAGGSDETNPEAMTEAALNRSYIKDAVSKLKGDKQKVILMRFIEGFSYGEIAQLLNKSEGAVRVIQHRALGDLRRMLTGSEWGK